jgi:hypothetical protein
MFRMAWPLAARAASAVGDDAASKALLGLLEGRAPAELPPVVGAELALARARLLPEGPARTSALDAAVTVSRAAGSPYHLAQALLDLADSRRSGGGDAAGLVAEARSIGRALQAPLLTRRADEGG